MNVKNNQIYNDKFELRVLQLNHIHLATETEKNSGIAHWASLFKAATWEEIKMLAHEKPIFTKVAQELYKSNTDEQIRYACQAREEYEFQMKRRQEMLDEYEFQMKRRQKQLEEYESQMKLNQAQLDELQAENNKLRLELERLKETKK
jgi:chromosome segregation ATPase